MIQAPPDLTESVLAPALAAGFATRVLAWFEEHGRHDLPWQVADAYAVWVSEIMLQQTQVRTVMNYFPRFMQRFPTVTALAQADWEEVAGLWAGLGYYARARNLHRAAQQVVSDGGFPNDLEGWMALPGIGRSTAGAIRALGQGAHGVIMDGNVRRVLCRYFALEGDAASTVLQRQLWTLATALTPPQQTAAYTQAMMDLGATICTPRKPTCLLCPLSGDCQAHRQGREQDFPHRKSRTAVPMRDSLALKICQGPRWLWQKRPAEGIWGGLWCLPLMDLSCHDLPAGQLGATLEHVLTHLRWRLQLLSCSEPVQSLEQRLQAGGLELAWMTPEDASQRGLPTAMHKLLNLDGAL